MRSVRWRVSRDVALVRLDVEFLDDAAIVAGFAVDMAVGGAIALAGQLLAAANDGSGAGQERRRKQPTLRRGH